MQRPGTTRNTPYQIGVILRTELERTDGTRRLFGEWLVAHIGSGTIEQFQTAANRDLALLRGMFRWPIGRTISIGHRSRRAART